MNLADVIATIVYLSLLLACIIQGATRKTTDSKEVRQFKVMTWIAWLRRGRR